MKQPTLSSRELPGPQGLAEWIAHRGHALGLTNYTTAQDVIQEAMAPALALPHLLGHSPTGPWCEIGPGSGALGMALAYACPAAHFDLVDRRERSVSFMDLTIRRFGLANAHAVLADLDSRGPLRPWTGVLFRALAAPPTALQLAAACATRWVCAWHAPALTDYDHPPQGLHLLARVATSSPTLVATLYIRSALPP